MPIRTPFRLPRVFMPLLVKELTEQSARRRSYILRVVACLLLLGFFWAMGGIRLLSSRPMEMLGGGSSILDRLAAIEYFGIYLLLPGMMAGVVAGEKERDSFILLLLTDLPPWEILLQKLLGRLIPMACFLLLGLPLMGVAYALGGVDGASLTMGILGLTATALQVGLVGLMWSCFCRSAAAAFVATYLTLASLYAGPLLLAGLCDMLLGRGHMDDDLLFFLPAYVFRHTSYRRPSFLLELLPFVGTLLVAAGLARLFVVRRALVQPRNLLLLTFRALDALMLRANRLTGGVIVFKSADRLPDDHPVAWREITKRALGKPHYLLRLLLVVEFPVLVAGSIGFAVRGADRLVFFVVILTWTVATILVVVQGVSAFASERSQQTLEVLLATPLSGREIVMGKVAGLRRLTLVLAIPLLSLVLLNTFSEVGPAIFGRLNYAYLVRRGLYPLIVGAATVLIYLPVLGWFGLWIGLRSRRPGRATVIALALVAAWCVLPVIVPDMLPYAFIRGITQQISETLGAIADYAGIFDDASREPSAYIGDRRIFAFLLSPAVVIASQAIPEIHPVRGGTMALVYMIHLALCLGMLLFFRTLSLRWADRYLGRVPDPVSYDPSRERPADAPPPFQGSSAT